VSSDVAHPDYFVKIGIVAAAHQVQRGEDAKTVLSIHETAVYCDQEDVIPVGPAPDDNVAPIRQSYSDFHHQVPALRLALGCGPLAEQLELVQLNKLSMPETNRRLNLPSDLVQFIPTEALALARMTDTELARRGNVFELQAQRDRLTDARVILLPIVASGHYTCIHGAQIFRDVWDLQYFYALPVQIQGCRNAATKIARRLDLFSVEVTQLPDSRPGPQKDGWSCGIWVLQLMEAKARLFRGEHPMPDLPFKAFAHRANEFIEKFSSAALAASQAAKPAKAFEKPPPETMAQAIEAAGVCTKCRITKASLFVISWSSGNLGFRCVQLGGP
jgi:hypothetical protein